MVGYVDAELGGVLFVTEYGTEALLGVWAIPKHSIRCALYRILSLVHGLRGSPHVLSAKKDQTSYFKLEEYLLERSSSGPPAGASQSHLFYPIEKLEDLFQRIRNHYPGYIRTLEESMIEDILERVLIYNIHDAVEHQLSKWIWSQWMQKELDSLKMRLNSLPYSRWSSSQHASVILPREKWLTEHEKNGSKNNLGEIDPSVVENLMEEIGGEEVGQFADPEYRAFAQPIYDEIVRKFKPTGMQDIFEKMLPQMRPFCAGRTT